MNPGSLPEIAVALYATDPLSALGAATLLRDGKLKVLAAADLALAEVIVVVEEVIGEGVFGFLREVRARSCLPSPPQCVIVTDHFGGDVLMTAVECGVAGLLELCDTGGEELVRTVLAVSQGSACLPPRVQGTLLAELGRMHRAALAGPTSL